MNQYPNSKVNVTGYADAGTGNDKINDRIAAKRAAKVVEELTTKYGIPADRITSDSKGARVQPFAENDKNRVSICICRIRHNWNVLADCSDIDYKEKRNLSLE